ncbi:MAG: hypothetical protein KAY54_06535 [Burkholderiaceae bacterium]|nr:hypothetical protein [Burkholderiaceae bacterium]
MTMYFGGRWVSLEFANTLFSFWMVEVLVLVAFVWWLATRSSPDKPGKDSVGARRPGNQAKRPKHGRRKT